MCKGVKENPDKINFAQLCDNSNAISIIKQYKKEIWDYEKMLLNRNKNAINLLFYKCH